MIKVTIDYGDGVCNEFHLSKMIEDELLSNRVLILETCHPNTGFIFKAKTIELSQSPELHNHT